MSNAKIEREQLLAAVRELVGAPADALGHTCDLIATETLRCWPDKEMRRLLDAVTPDDIEPARRAANVIAAKVLENLEARWDGDVDSDAALALEVMLDGVIVALINIWFASDAARDGFNRVKRNVRANATRRRR